MLRYITRAVLIPFNKSGTASDSLTPNERRKLDLELTERMQEASKGLGTIIKLGKKMVKDDDLMDKSMERLKNVLGSNSIKQRLHLSYSLLILSTLKVCKL